MLNDFLRYVGLGTIIVISLRLMWTLWTWVMWVNGRIRYFHSAEDTLIKRVTYLERVEREKK